MLCSIAGNVLDFGMTVDIESHGGGPVSVNIQSLVSLLAKYRGADMETLLRGIEGEIKSLLSFDLYCDVEDDRDCARGWEEAKVIYLTSR